MPMIISSLLPISSGDAYVDSLSVVLYSIGEMHDWYTIFLELQRPHCKTSPHLSFSIFLSLEVRVVSESLNFQN